MIIESSTIALRENSHGNKAQLNIQIEGWGTPTESKTGSYAGGEVSIPGAG